jgi:L-iditol 2-dehydrogenase
MKVYRKDSDEMNASIPEKMNALVLTAPEQFEIRQVPVPKPGLHEVLCRVQAVAICGTDPEVVRGGFPGFWPPDYPFIPGHEWAGDVVALGEGVTGFQIGDRVAGEAWKGCGICDNCVAGKYNLCENYDRLDSGLIHYGFRHQGAYAQYNAFSVKAVHKMPDNVSYLEGSMVDTVGPGMHCIDMMGITTGGTIALIGPGPIGLCAMQAALATGASRAIAVGRGARLQAAGEMGADILIDFEKEDPVDAVRAATGGSGVNQVFEGSGAPGTLVQGVMMLKQGGRVGLLAVPDDTLKESLPYKYICRNEIGIFGVKANPNVAARIVSLIASGKIKVKNLVTHTFPLEEFGSALDTFVKRREGAIKVVIEPNGPEN